MLDLMPVPAAVVARRGGRLVLEQPNAAFRVPGLGTIEGRSQALVTLRERLTGFFDSDAMRTDFPWSVGELIDSRHYGVTLVRPEAPPCDRCVMTLVDQTSQRHTERSLRREMTTDSLTGLPNREGFGTVIEDVERRPRASCIAGRRPGAVRAAERVPGVAGGGRTAHHRRAPAEGRAARLRSARADRRGRIRHPDGDRRGSQRGAPARGPDPARAVVAVPPDRLRDRRGMFDRHRVRIGRGRRRRGDDPPRAIRGEAREGKRA